MQRKLYAGILFFMLLFLPFASYAVNDNANCGPGKTMAQNANAIITLNITSSVTYAGATTSSTSGCEGPFAEQSAARRLTQIYIAHNYEKLSEEIAQGQGFYLDALASMMGCSKEAHPLFSQVAHQNYSEFFEMMPVADQDKYISAEELMGKIEHSMVLSPELSQMCSAS